MDDVMKDLNEDSNADVVYLDFRKAFDRVDHTILLKKLHHYGIRDKVLTWFEAFLRDRKQYVLINGVKSRTIEVVSGVPQGTVLGPLLFLLYVDDLSEVVINCLLKLFADDSKLQKLIRSMIDHAALQKDMEAVEKWARLNNMALNSQKYQLLQHGKIPELKVPYYLEDGSELLGSEVVRDLGVHVDNALNWKIHIQTKVTEASKKAGWILRTFTSRDQDVMLLLYKSYVRSLVEYCCPVWSPHLVGEIVKVEGIQRSFTSRIAGLHSLNYWERLKALNLYSLQRRRERFTIILMWKIEKSLIPNVASIEFKNSLRRGTTCSRPLGKSKYSSTNTVFFNSFSSVGPALYNIIPNTVKSCSTLLTFKSGLDKWLSAIPDKPPTPGYLSANRNSLLEWVVGVRC